MKKILKKLILNLIELLENIEYKNKDLDQDDVDKKILNSLSTKNIKVKTDTGYEPISELHITQPYDNYELVTEDFKLICADNHIVFGNNFEEFFVKDLRVGYFIQTERGLQKVLKIEKLKHKNSMFDVSVDHPNHRLYTDGILSHNTISSAIFMLHKILFDNDKNIMIVANKGDTAVEIVDKIKSIYTLLPFFLKPGVKTWNQKSLTFENGCRIKTSARTKTPAIGFTIDVLYMDEFAHIPSNIIGPYYTAAFPTTAAVQNSKIIITSTPNGMNLFHDLLTNAERPDGDPKKNNYRAKRVYWYEVPGRFVTYVRINNHKLHENKITLESVLEQIKDKWSDITDIKLKWDGDKQKDVIHIDNNDNCSDEEIKSFWVKNEEDKDIPLQHIAEITTWKEEAIKDIGGEDAFNQEYGLRFINASKSLLNESIIKDLLGNRHAYEYIDIPKFNDKLRFSYGDLKWTTNEDLFNIENRKKYKIILSVDISEGLGQDYSIINIFKMGLKDKETIMKQKDNYGSIVDFFRLEQIGIFRSNLVSVKQLSEILYLIAFEFFDPDNVKIVLELNNYGNTLLAEMPHVFDGNNIYGSYIFIRYKHRVDSNEEKIGLKVGNNKNLLVKDYQTLVTNKNYLITHHETVGEITTFVKHTTSAGNVKYAADVGHDDTVMTIVNSTSVFKKDFFRQMCEEYLDSPFVTNDMRNFVNKCKDESEYIETIDYTQVLAARKKYSGLNTGYGRKRNPGGYGGYGPRKGFGGF
jgi:hypothetical protein